MRMSDGALALNRRTLSCGLLQFCYVLFRIVGEYPDCATCAAAEHGRAIEAHALKVSATATDFVMQVSLADGVRLVSGAMEEDASRPDIDETKFRTAALMVVNFVAPSIRHPIL
jgi:hypothetical protein